MTSMLCPRVDGWFKKGRKEGRKEGGKIVSEMFSLRRRFLSDCRCEIVGNSGRKTLIQREGEKVESIVDYRAVAIVIREEVDLEPQISLSKVKVEALPNPYSVHQSVQ